MKITLGRPSCNSSDGEVFAQHKRLRLGSRIRNHNSGVAQSRRGLVRRDFYHPCVVGHRQVPELSQSLVGVPPPATRIGAKVAHERRIESHRRRLHNIEVDDAVAQIDLGIQSCAVRVGEVSPRGGVGEIVVFIRVREGCTQEPDPRGER